MIAASIQHKRQEKKYSCGAACYAMLLGISEEQARKEVKTRYTGTFSGNVVKALEARGLIAHHLTAGMDYFTHMDSIRMLSYRWPLYLACAFVSRHSKKGKATTRHHAVVAADGMFYDPSENQACPVEAFAHTFNKRLEIRDIILIEEERPDYLENMRREA